MKRTLLTLVAIVTSTAGVAHDAGAQTLVATDDDYGIPFGLALDVEPFGVLDNDRLDGEPAGEAGATAELVNDVVHGVLVLNEDGSFTYTPGATFDGADRFDYRAVFGAASSEATVTLSACEGGPDVFTCWNESAFLAKAVELGLGSFVEGFEDDGVWGGARSPVTAPAVTSQGVTWQSNHPDAPAFNEITTGSGAAYTGEWGIFDPEHGYATGTAGECDVDDPPSHCLYHDGITGIRDPELGSLHGVGGMFHGIYGAKVGILLDEAPAIGGGTLTTSYRFFGAIDARPAGFTRFEFRELDGKIGQALYVWADDFTLLVADPISVPGAVLDEPVVFFSGAATNPGRGVRTLIFSTSTPAQVSVSLFDVYGRLVRRLVDEPRGPGRQHVEWDGRDQRGRDVSAGTYFARLVVGSEGRYTTRVRKVVVLP